MAQKIITQLLLSSLFLLLTNICSASGYKIFGKITTVENEVYTGYITWNQSKTYWIDYFHADKINNPYATYFKNNTGIKFQQNGRSYSYPMNHQFVCRFGNMKKIRLTAPNRIQLELKGNQQIELKRGQFNDIGNSVTLQNDSIQTTFPWEKISEIEFTNSPESATQPLPYGSVKSSHGIYSGIIKWNSGRQNNVDQFQIYAYPQDINVSQQQIKKIELQKRHCIITYNDNRKYDLSNIDNNNNQRKSITVLMPNIGKVVIPWNNLESQEFISQGQNKLLSYDDFKPSKALQGEVVTQGGERLSGTIVYDLDEALDCEIFDGQNDNVNYSIPFKYIHSIEPKNYKYSFITLKNGSALSLGNTQDTNMDNTGIMLYSPNQLPVYIPWNEVKQVIFE